MPARLLLAALIGWLIAGEVTPDLRLPKIWLGADQVTHIIVVYALTLAAAMAFPRAGVGLIALGVACLGSAVELGQYAGLLRGSAQFHDFTANFAGVAGAALPLWIARSPLAGGADTADEGEAEPR